jgi:serine/threonine/tyrosine-interacting protein
MADLGPLNKQEMHLVRTLDDHRVRMQEIVPRIFLGPFTAVRDVLELRKHGVTHIVNLSQCAARVAQQLGLTVLDVSIQDKPLADLWSHVPTICAFVDQALDENPHHVVLFNCMMGISRSGAALVAYLMHRDKLPYKAVLQCVRHKRPCVCPNHGFRFQLSNQRLPSAVEAAELTRQDEEDADHEDEVEKEEEEEEEEAGER